MARVTNTFFNGPHAGGTAFSASWSVTLIDALSPAVLYVKYRGNTGLGDVMVRLLAEDFDGVSAGGRVVDAYYNESDIDSRIALANLPDSKYRVWVSAPVLSSLKVWITGQVLVTGIL